ncbi:hypothetical protein PLESTF_001115900 [Pleodorina starrii]|nr:hypothetical protein PLESTM_001833300 [Pleodorina starrii]GLC71438.1 hypothetical protein PLESTF_001115900 [Pleodorina starrii]
MRPPRRLVSFDVMLPYLRKPPLLDVRAPPAAPARTQSSLSDNVAISAGSVPQLLLLALPHLGRLQLSPRLAGQGPHFRAWFCLKGKGKKGDIKRMHRCPWAQ